MKLHTVSIYFALIQSHPVRGAWIEIDVIVSVRSSPLMSHPVRGAWIEIEMEKYCKNRKTGRIP